MNDSNITIRKAKEADYEAINQLYLVSYELYHKNIPEVYNKPPKNTLPKGTFLNILEDKETEILVAEKDGKVVGMTYIRIEDADDDDYSKGYHRVAIDEIAVLPEFSRAGIGSLLLTEVENWAKSLDIYDLNVLTYCFNEPAIKFYEKNNFSPYSLVLNKKLKK